MCHGVCYIHEGRTIITYFPYYNSVLPAKLKTGEHALLPWGRRKRQAGKLPLGGWCGEESLEKGLWDEFFPKPVKLPVLKFMEADIESNSQWFDITNGNFIQGILASYKEERRLYVVTIKQQAMNATYPRWPKIFFCIKD